MRNRLISLLFFYLLILSCNNLKYTQGQRIYTSLCSNCHMEDGSGLNQVIPSIANSKYLLEKDENLICVIHKGVNADSLGIKENYMPSFKKLTDVELTNLINYIQENFNQSKFEYKLDEVKSFRRNCTDNK